MHWTGGVGKWGSEATTWQHLDSDVILATWEKCSERGDIMFNDDESLATSWNAELREQLMLLPQEGRSGVIGKWISAAVRGNRSKAQVVEYLGPPS